MIRKQFRELKDYCPYESSSDARSIDLAHREFVSARYGRISYWVRAGDSHEIRSATLFLHGVGGTWSSWTPLIREADRVEEKLGPLILVDLPGFGRSENLLRSLDAMDVAIMLEELLRDAGVRSVRLVGQSMGGFLALTMASRSTGIVRDVTVFSGTLFYMSEIANGRLRRYLPDITSRGGRVKYVCARASGVPVRGIARMAALTGLMRRSLRRTAAHPESVRRSVLASIARGIRPECFLLAAQNGLAYDPMTLWRDIRVPARAVFGAKDQLVGPREESLVRENLTNIQTVVIQDCGHFAPWERPSAALAALTSALD